MIQTQPIEPLTAEAEAPVSCEAAATEAAHCVHLGRVAFVTGSQVVALISANAPLDKPQLSIGSLVKTESALSTVYAIVSGLSIALPAESAQQQDIMTVEAELLGEVPNPGGHLPPTFRRGVSCPPQLNSPVLTTTKEDLQRVFAKPEAATAAIGTLHQDQDVPAYIVTNDLLGKHCAIVGTTGCGKSSATTLIIRAVTEQSPESHIVLLDPHNEYSQAFASTAEVLDTSNLELPYWLLEFDELLGIIAGAGQKAEQSEISILNEAIPAVKRQFMRGGDEGKRITVDTPVPYRLNDLVQYIDTLMGKLDKAVGTAPYQKLKARLQSLQSDPRYGFMFGGVSIRDNLDKILGRIFRVPVDGKPISILDLSGVPSEIVNTVVSVLCRLTFDFALWCDSKIPILLVCEEAHRYAAKSDDQGFEPTKRTLARIAKEGRKYGVSLCLVSQRPSEMDSGILSQCNTVFAMRLTNQQDQEVMRAIISDSSQGLFESLPTLGNAEAIAVGEGVAVPMRLCFDTLPKEFSPRSQTADFVSAWKGDHDDPAALKEIVERWRWQSK